MQRTWSKKNKKTRRTQERVIQLFFFRFSQTHIENSVCEITKLLSHPFERRFTQSLAYIRNRSDSIPLPISSKNQCVHASSLDGKYFPSFAIRFTFMHTNTPKQCFRLSNPLHMLHFELRVRDNTYLCSRNPNRIIVNQIGNV